MGGLPYNSYHLTYSNFSRDYLRGHGLKIQRNLISKRWVGHISNQNDIQQRVISEINSVRNLKLLLGNETNPLLKLDLLVLR